MNDELMKITPRIETAEDDFVSPKTVTFEQHEAYGFACDTMSKLQKLADLGVWSPAQALKIGEALCEDLAKQK
jgi:hypothetical protein